MYAQLYNPKTIEKKYSTINITDNQRKAANEWIKKLKNKELEKEKKNYFVFRDVVLRDLLGYPEEKILYEEKNVEFSIQDEHGDTGVCFEAKGTKTKDLFTRQGYEKKEQENPVVQTLSNMERFPASYGVCTNYRNFVLLDIKKRLSKCHRFDFLSIENSDKKLKEFLGIFSYKNLIIKKSLEELYNSSVSEEREFTKEFYKLFHETRLMLIKAFQEKEHVDMEEALHYAQLFLNRLIFVFFASDKGDIESRLFTNRILKILEAGKSSESSRLIFDNISKLFKDLDKGADIQGIFGFNGGLFQEQLSSKIYFFDLKDPEFFREVQQHSKLSKKVQLDELSSKIIKKYKGQLNPIISNLLIMDSFDFNSEINVNILGHVFEQSISYLEELKQKGVSKRKKEGVFYTPEYITEYICYNTIIPYLSKQNVTTIHELIKEYFDNIEELEHRIQEIKILDPACGSGAFLIKAVEILLEIDKEIQSIKPHTGEQATLEEFSQAKEITRIIEQNIFGVDINEESVEITKLSLFLKMAAPNKKLTDLSKNIRVGNSLVNESSIDVKAFDWNNEFKKILNDGGFDVVIGNPPYLRIQGLHESHDHITKFLEKNYVSATGRYDYYVLFIERGSSFLKKNGYFGFITPHKFTSAEFGIGIRKYLSEKNLLHKFVNFTHNFVFEDAAIYTGILILKNIQNQVLSYTAIEDRGNKPLESTLIQLKTKDFGEIDLTNFDENAWNLTVGKDSKILNKIKKHENILKFFDKIPQGIVTGDNDLFILKPIKNKNKTMIVFSNKTGNEVELEKEVLKPITTGFDIKKYMPISENQDYILYPHVLENNKTRPLEEKELKKNFPLAYSYLSQFKEACIRKKKKYKTNPTYWFGLHNSRNLNWFSQERIVTAQITLGCNMTIDSHKFVHNEQVYSFLKKSENNIDNKYFLGILNSKLMWFFMKNIGVVLRGGYFRFKTKYLEDFHIALPSDKKIENLMIVKVQKNLETNETFKKKYSKFINRLNTEFKIDKPTKKLEKFYETSFNEFLSLLKKYHKIKLNLTEQDQWEDYFKSYKKDLIELKTQSDKLDNEINQLVYKIYSLSDDEILIVDENYPKSV